MNAPDTPPDLAADVPPLDWDYARTAARRGRFLAPIAEAFGDG